MSTGIRVPGRRRQVMTREPGDLPSAVVMRERCRSGCTGGQRTDHPSLDVRDTEFAVTCHRACYPRCLLCVCYPGAQYALLLTTSYWRRMLTEDRRQGGAVSIRVGQ